MEQELKDIVYSYEVLKKSTYQIAKEYGTHPNIIRRKLLSLGVVMRTKSEAQKTALEEGRHSHPTKGRKRTESEKIKISEKVAKFWEDMSDDDKAERSKIAKINWDSMTDEEKENLRKKAGKAVRDAAENGSKLERFLLIELQRKGYKVNFHKTNVVTNEELEMDLFLPETNPPIAIEVDGPAHFFPIWGEESLAKHITADNQKNGLLIESGYKVIRIKHLVKNLSEIHKRKVLTSLLEVLSSIESGSENNLFEIEVK